MKYKKIHFVGIKGVGMTPLAIIAKEAGLEVTGSDIETEFITDEALEKAGIKPLAGFSKEHVDGADLVITTGAHGGFSNIEVVTAGNLRIKVLTQGEAVGVFMNGGIFDRHFTGLSVCGTHGKTTTTALVATILSTSGMDPSYLIGTSFIPSLGLPGHYGKGEYFVAESDEYATEPVFDKTPKFLWQHPQNIIITNVNYDHPDVYQSIDMVIDAFLKFARGLPEDGLLITCGDNGGVKKLLEKYKGRKITYGLNKDNDIVASYIKNSEEETEFVLTEGKSEIGKFSINISGEHNILNATAAILMCRNLGLNMNTVQKGLTGFTGTKRRFEYIGTLVTGAKLYDDYAHHPVEIEKTLQALKLRFPEKKIACVFQPHTYSRTKSLFEQFITSFKDADIIILTEIYSSLRESKDETVSSKDLADKIRQLNKEVIFRPYLSDVVEYIRQRQFDESYVVITMGAGDVYKIGTQLKFK